MHLYKDFQAALDEKTKKSAWDGKKYEIIELVAEAETQHDELTSEGVIYKLKYPCEFYNLSAIIQEKTTIPNPDFIARPTTNSQALKNNCEYYIPLPIKNGTDLDEYYEEIKKSLSTLTNKPLFTHGSLCKLYTQTLIQKTKQTYIIIKMELTPTLLIKKGLHYQIPKNAEPDYRLLTSKEDLIFNTSENKAPIDTNESNSESDYEFPSSEDDPEMEENSSDEEKIKLH